ncbi:hypothetical protein UFOVP1351_7 [uncultured Caudovirales phage]|uniref:Uncharacterized protein n=1 Tax=uncultured Caudovirales phage TaxID=2100421 RepID=A0A6J5RRI1_9CAUD|nr:hypothetical protein UFOVP1351_7 [uncultured Caudovirales phage]
MAKKPVRIDLPTNTSEEAAAAPEMDKKQALKGSLEAIRETKKLLQEGQFPGAYANKVIGCLAYLNAIENQLREKLDS